MLSDNHMHTRFSGDSDAEPSDMISAAHKKNLSGVTFTDHLDWDYAAEPGLFDLDIPGYLSYMNALREQVCSGSFTLRVGIELGLQPHLAGRHTALLSDNDFDFVIGSVHQVGGQDPYYDDFFDGRTMRETYDAFLIETLSNLKAFPYIDTLGHLDYICRYGQRVTKARGEDGTFSYDNHADIIDEILTFLINHDIALEVNTGACRYGYDEPNPSYAILSRYRYLGGRLLTLGADAHSPADVAGAFDVVIPRLKAAGFSSYYVFEKRRPLEKPLDE